MTGAHAFGRGLVFVLLWASSACDRSPTGPSAPDPPAFSLRPGSYALTIGVDARSSSGPANPCTEATTAADRVVIPVTVDLDGSTWRVRPVADADLGLAAALQSPSRNLLVGPVEGRARDLNTGVVVSVSQRPPILGLASFAPPSLFGTLEGADLVSGIVNGEVRFTLAGGTRVCSSNLWRLDPR